MSLRTLRATSYTGLNSQPFGKRCIEASWTTAYPRYLRGFCPLRILITPKNLIGRSIL
ncbi:hypothetical protein Hanom_Chr07g00590221 [Helianthus anomalus]